jgi:hypothetical protein
MRVAVAEALIAAPVLAVLVVAVLAQQAELLALGLQILAAAAALERLAPLVVLAVLVLSSFAIQALNEERVGQSPLQEVTPTTPSPLVAHTPLKRKRT